MSNNLGELRKRLGWTQARIAEGIGTTVGQYAKLERGERRLTRDWIERAASAFGVNASEIVRDGSGPPEVGRILNPARVEWASGEPSPGLTELALVVDRGALGPLLAGGALLFRHERRPPRSDDEGRVALVCVKGEVVVGRVHVAGAYTFHVETYVTDAAFNVSLEWLSPVLSLRFRVS